MIKANQRRQHERWLLEVTGIPTAAGHEDRVKEWVRAWARQRHDDLNLREDRAGNMLITQRRRPRSGRPMFFTAHLDHPAFVLKRRLRGGRLELEFRGGVHPPYFDNAAIDVFDDDDRTHRAVIDRLNTKAKPFKTVTATLRREAPTLEPGAVGRWAFRGRGAKPVVHEGKLHTPACDDLAAVAGALSALDVLRRHERGGHVGVLLTVAEEIGFIGAIAACRMKTVPKSARLICLENSRSFAESPIGGGPILRVGDRVSVFSPDLTNRIGRFLLDYQKRRPSFRYQRRLMPGGACEATTFAAYGYDSTCVCLPLGNYHNMKDIDAVLAGKRPARVAPEFISVADYHGMVEMLALCGAEMDDAKIVPLKDWMESLGKEKRFVVGA